MKNFFKIIGVSIISSLVLGLIWVKNFVVIKPQYVGKQYNFLSSPENQNIFNIWIVPILIFLFVAILASRVIWKHEK